MQGEREQVYYTNRESLPYWNINPKHLHGRTPGLSAMVRVKDEAEWITFSLDSVVDWCDEVAIFIQGTQTDRTRELVAAWAWAHQAKTVVYEYPFESLPNGPGHNRQPRGSVHERAYFYNWCLARTHYQFAMKWDGDMVALDWLGAAAREAMRMHDVIRVRGIDIAGVDLKRMSAKPYTANEPRIFRVTPATFYYSGEKCEYFTFTHRDGFALGDGYLHFKWAKAIESARKDWPDGWERTAHFTRINKRRLLGHTYTGTWPAVLEAERERRKHQC